MFDIDRIYNIVENGLSHISDSRMLQMAKVDIARDITSYCNSLNEDLEHFRDTHIGLWATDIEPIDKTNFFQIK